MIKKIFTLLFIYISLSISSQEELLTFNNDLKESSSNLKDVIPIVNNETGEMAFFIADAKNVYGYKIGADFKIKSKISSEEKSRKLKTLIGYGIDKNNDYKIFLTDKNKINFMAISYSFSDKSVASKEFSLPKNESYILTTNLNNRFVLLTASKNENKLFVYTFSEDHTLKKDFIDTTNLTFINSKGERKTATSILASGEEIHKYEENTPNTIEITSYKKKMYERDNGVIITLNVNDSFTQIIELDLIQLKATTLYFKTPLADLNKNSKKANSYLNGGSIFSFAVSKKGFSFEVADLKSQNLIKRYEVLKDDEISFKNTPIIQEGGIYKNYRELSKTKQFIRKIYSGSVGISVKKYHDFYHIIMGGYVVQKTGGGMMMPMMGGLPIATFGSATMFINPTQFAFNSFGNNKATRIEGLFDNEFNHKEGEIPENAFDKMHDFESNDNGNGSTVFKYKDFYIKTKYNSFSKEMVFRKFSD